MVLYVQVVAFFAVHAQVQALRFLRLARPERRTPYRTIFRMMQRPDDGQSPSDRHADS